MVKIILIVAGLLLIFGAVATFSTQNRSDAKSQLTLDTVQQDIGDSGQLIDVRTSEEYNEGHIDGAINLPLQNIASGNMPTAQKDAPIYLYCRTGSRSAEATALLKTAGYTNLHDLGSIAYVQSIGGTIIR